MNRTFHHRFTLGSKCGVILFAVLAIYLFWVKAVVAGAILIVLNVLIIDRVLHSEYVFSDDTLTIVRGRFFKPKTILLADIKSCRAVTTPFKLSHYLLLEYGSGRYVSAEPEQEASFVKCLQNRKVALMERQAGIKQPDQQAEG